MYMYLIEMPHASQPVETNISEACIIIRPRPDFLQCKFCNISTNSHTHKVNRHKPSTSDIQRIGQTTPINRSENDSGMCNAFIASQCGHFFLSSVGILLKKQAQALAARRRSSTSFQLMIFQMFFRYSGRRLLYCL